MDPGIFSCVSWNFQQCISELFLYLYRIFIKIIPLLITEFLNGYRVCCLFIPKTALVYSSGKRLNVEEMIMGSNPDMNKELTVMNSCP
jgi:hypothetical protein